jgi:hypothetical protein
MAHARSTGGKRGGRILLAIAGALLGLGAVSASPAQPAGGAAEPASTGGPTTLRRLSEAQYTRAVHDLFGEGVEVGGRFDPPLRADGLLAIGAGKVAVSTSGFEQYEIRAREIAGQVLSGEQRSEFLPCGSRTAVFDRACAADFIAKYGLRLYRRPLTGEESASLMALAEAATKRTGSFAEGMQASLSRMLASAHFIFRVERTEPDPARPGMRRLDDWSLASRISFLLWNAPPDFDLLDAARSGALRTPQGRAAQVDRLIAAPRFVDGVRAFFSDMFAYDQFEGLSKDQTIYAKYTSQLAADAREQTLRTIIDLLVTRRGDYRDLFTTRQTFMNRNLGALYRVPVSRAALGGWEPHTFGKDEPRAGILTLAAFLMLDPTHEGRSSPTIRGKSVRELLMCQPVPLPPGNVDFSNFEDPAGEFKTARERLQAHSAEPVCAGCHKITDPIGLSLEHYDAIGQYRTHENGAVIDASGTLEDVAYRDALSMQQALRNSPATPACLVQRTWEYAVGRQTAPGETVWLDYAASRFAADGYTFPALLRRIAMSEAFARVSPGQVAGK